MTYILIGRPCPDCDGTGRGLPIVDDHCRLCGGRGKIEEYEWNSGGTKVDPPLAEDVRPPLGNALLARLLLRPCEPLVDRAARDDGNDDEE